MNRNFTKIFKIISLNLLIVLFLLFPVVTKGAELFWQATKSSSESKNVFLALILNTESDKINALAGEVSLLSSGWELVSVSDANSFINFWVERPSLGLNNKQVRFSGITPGGYLGEALILKLEFKPSITGASYPDIAVNNFNALINDGKGTAATIKIKGLITTAEDKEILKPIPLAVDTERLAPEPFKLAIIKDSDLSPDQLYLIFNTQDKSSGMAYYEVRESLWPIWNTKVQSESWVRAESPYQLKNQSWWNFIYVRAVNKNGGVRIAKLYPQLSFAWLYRYSLILVIIVVSMTLLILLRRVSGNKK